MFWLFLIGMGVVAAASRPARRTDEYDSDLDPTTLERLQIRPPAVDDGDDPPAHGGSGVCSFGIEEHCHWTPILAKSRGLHEAQWGWCLQDWTNELDSIYGGKEGYGGIHTYKRFLDIIKPILNTLTLGLSDALEKRICIRWKWQLQQYEIEGSSDTWWALRYLRPEKGILGKVNKPPQNPLGTGKDVAWTHAGDSMIFRGSLPSDKAFDREIVTLWFVDGTYVECIRNTDMRRALSYLDLDPVVVSTWAKQSSGKKSRWILSTRSKAMDVHA